MVSWGVARPWFKRNGKPVSTQLAAEMRTRNVPLKKLTSTLFGVYLALLLAVGILTSGCEPGGEPIIENQRDEDIRIYVTVIRSDYPDRDPSEEIDYGIVPARTTRELASIVFPRRYWVHRIQAKDRSGKVVFSHDYNLDDLEKIKWRITIPP